MKKLIRKALVACLLMGLCVPLAAAQCQDYQGSKDHPMVSRYPGSCITDYKTTEFEEFALPLGKLDRDDVPVKSQHLEGKITFIKYETPGGRSELEVFRNYESALKTAGFEILFSCAHPDGCGHGDPTLWQGNGREPWEDDNMRVLSAKLSRPEGDVYVSLLVSEYGAHYVRLYVVEVKPMESGLITVNAAALQGGLAKAGHVEVPGIFFDTNKSDVKPESKPALDEVAKMLKATPSMKVWVVGHTDSVGTLDANMKLSEARAAAVARALVADYGIGAARLKGLGVGPLSPVASNKTDEGRAKNRRVELVEE
jgi:OmpA-OmpF porin, OOP family